MRRPRLTWKVERGLALMRSVASVHDTEKWQREDRADMDRAIEWVDQYLAWKAWDPKLDGGEDDDLGEEVP